VVVVSESLVKALAQKYGVSEEDVKLALEMIGGEDELSKMISTITTAGEALAKTPENVQQAIAPLIAATVLRQLSTDPFQQKMLSLTGSLLTIKTLLGEDKGVEKLVDSVMSELKTLNEKIAKIEESKRSEEIQALAESVENLRKGLEELREELKMKVENQSTAVAQQATATNLLANIRSQLEEFSSTLNTLVDTLKALGFEVKKPGEVKPVDDIDRAKQLLEKYGYEIKPRYMTEEEFQRRLQEERRRLEKLFEKKLRKSEKIAEAKARQVEALAALGLEVIRYLRSLTGQAQAGGGVVEVARRRALQGVLQAQQDTTQSA
jgi:DNA repair exonuclease SbcCD ATPase subunit